MNVPKVGSRDSCLPGGSSSLLLGDSAMVGKEGKVGLHGGRILNPTTLAVSQIWGLCFGRQESPSISDSCFVKGKKMGSWGRLTRS